jgi:glycosyltransferase involved in cell wall biosynthesis
MREYKILFIARNYPSSKNPIAGVFIKEHAKAISLYEEVVVITAEYERGLQSLYRINSNIENGIRVLRVSYRKSPIPKTTYLIYLWGILSAFGKLRREGWNPDIIHAHIYSAGVPAIILGKYYKIPVVVSEHFSSFPRRMIKRFERLKATFALNKANLIITVSEDLINHIKLYGIKNKFKVVPNTFDPKIFYPPIKKKPRITKRLLLVASLIPIKGIPYLLEALALLCKKRNDFILDIVGDGTKRKEHEKLAYHLRLRNIVAFHGVKSKKEVAKFMRKADFFVLPSEWENLPCALIEAMASGLPIVATNVGGVPEIINVDVGVLVPPRNVEALTEAINYLLDHYHNYPPGKIASYAYKRFSYKTIGEKLNAIYRRVTLNG